MLTDCVIHTGRAAPGSSAAGSRFAAISSTSGLFSARAASECVKLGSEKQQLGAESLVDGVEKCTSDVNGGSPARARISVRCASQAVWPWRKQKTGREHNFDQEDTNNLGTPYDFNSVMQYSKYAFSKNGKPTIVSKGNPNLNFGRATQMSANDIARVNALYSCPR